MDNASPVVVNTGAPLGRVNTKVAVPLAAEKVVEASPAAVDAGEPQRKSMREGRPLWPP
jgi:hypothetical protein